MLETSESKNYLSRVDTEQLTSSPSRRQTLGSLKAYLAARLDSLDAAARFEARAARRQLLRVSEQLAALQAEVRARAAGRNSS
jgi:hypothetical protein